MTSSYAAAASRQHTVNTRALLTCGAIAGPLFVGTVLIQEATRVGFDPVKHPLSMLSLSELGWIQITNFVLSGLLALAGAIGLARTMPTGIGSTWGPRLLGTYGVALIAGGVFVTDPGFGYPVGTPDAAPESITWHGILHSIAPVVAGIALLAACVVFARRFHQQGRTGWFATSITIPTLHLTLSAITFAATDFRWMLTGGSLIWLWASAVMALPLFARQER
ncbi:DUF998 domain-containing protein [Nocardia goodfellowii]|uniref:Uncharacterized membrane protein YhaH (DUF805 family) n=1 Tax=Nocardia goodfellowii TaxID=882446 RepID=A0ABS4QAS5_9NOCA|nr:DUF998 domain-containing protein [Nocardia goodfellowii]MBP2188806.1 uncharacterized membrane protein YhaH (DUF805 family) [Nocardia goodfellowii]